MSNLQQTNSEKILLSWVRQCTRSYPEVNVLNFTTSWADGLALNGILHHFRWGETSPWQRHVLPLWPDETERRSNIMCLHSCHCVSGLCCSCTVLVLWFHLKWILCFRSTLRPWYLPFDAECKSYRAQAGICDWVCVCVRLWRCPEAVQVAEGQVDRSTPAGSVYTAWLTLFTPAVSLFAHARCECVCVCVRVCVCVCCVWKKETGEECLGCFPPFE